jgi:hypothetical protein
MRSRMPGPLADPAGIRCLLPVCRRRCHGRGRRVAGVARCGRPLRCPGHDHRRPAGARLHRTPPAGRVCPGRRLVRRAWCAPAFDPEPFIEDRSGWPAAQAWLAGYLASRDLADLEEQTTPTYVSNPWAGDVVLGHLIVMAELGLGTLTARAPRDPGIFEGAWSRPGGPSTSWPGWVLPGCCGALPAAR